MVSDLVWMAGMEPGSLICMWMQIATFFGDFTSGLCVHFRRYRDQQVYAARVFILGGIGIYLQYNLDMLISIDLLRLVSVLVLYIYLSQLVPRLVLSRTRTATILPGKFFTLGLDVRPEQQATLQNTLHAPQAAAYRPGRPPGTRTYTCTATSKQQGDRRANLVSHLVLARTLMGSSWTTYRWASHQSFGANLD